MLGLNNCPRGVVRALQYWAPKTNGRQAHEFRVLPEIKSDTISRLLNVR